MELTGQPQQERDGCQQHEAESRTEHQFLSQRIKTAVTQPQAFPANAIRCQYDCQSNEGIRRLRSSLPAERPVTRKIRRYRSR